MHLYNASHPYACGGGKQFHMCWYLINAKHNTRPVWYYLMVVRQAHVTAGLGRKNDKVRSISSISVISVESCLPNYWRGHQRKREDIDLYKTAELVQNQDRAEMNYEWRYTTHRDSLKLYNCWWVDLCVRGWHYIQMKIWVSIRLAVSN